MVISWRLLKYFQKLGILSLYCLPSAFHLNSTVKSYQYLLLSVCNNFHVNFIFQTFLVYNTIPQYSLQREPLTWKNKHSENQTMYKKISIFISIHFLNLFKKRRHFNYICGIPLIHIKEWKINTVATSINSTESTIWAQITKSTRIVCLSKQSPNGEKQNWKLNFKTVFEAQNILPRETMLHGSFPYWASP